eukprot:gene2628-5530_t
MLRADCEMKQQTPVAKLLSIHTAGWVEELVVAANGTLRDRSSRLGNGRQVNSCSHASPPCFFLLVISKCLSSAFVRCLCNRAFEERIEEILQTSHFCSVSRFCQEQIQFTIRVIPLRNEHLESNTGKVTNIRLLVNKYPDVRSENV